MANVSAFGFGGYDYIGSIGEGKISTKLGLSAKKKSNKMDMRYQKSMMDYQQQLQQEQMQFQSALNQKNQIWAANALPEQTVKGLRAANLNPLLAFSDFSGLASSGAMGVSPSSVGGASPGSTVDVDMGSGTTSGFEADAIDRLRNRKFDRRSRELAVKQTEAAIDQTECNSALTTAQTERTREESKTSKVVGDINASTAVDQADAKREQAQADRAEAYERRLRAQLNASLLTFEGAAALGRPGYDPRFSDQANEFWNDFYRNRQDYNRYINSATRAKVLDSVQIGKDAAGAVSDFLPTSKAIRSLRTGKRKKK